MGRTSIVEIDGEKLRLELAKRGEYSLGDAGEKIFASKCFFSTAIREGRLGYNKTVAIEKILGIPLAAYKKEDKPVATIKEQPKQTANTKELENALDIINNNLNEFKNNTMDIELEMAASIENIENAITEMATSIKTIENLLAQINEKCMKR